MFHQSHPPRTAATVLAAALLLVVGCSGNASVTASNPTAGAPTAAPLRTNPPAAGSASAPAAAVVGSGNASSGSLSGSAACARVTAAEMQSTLGLQVGDGEPMVNDTVTVCKYTATQGGATVRVRFSTGVSKGGFKDEQDGFDQHGEPTTPVSGLGDAAFSATIGTGAAQTNTVDALKGSTGVLVTANAPLDKVQALTMQVLASL